MKPQLECGKLFLKYHKMHIGFLTPEFPNISSSSGGLGTSIKNLSAALVARGINVSIFVYGHSENKKYKKDGISFHLIKQVKYRVLGWYLYRKRIEKYLKKIILEEKIDLIEAPDWTGITAFINLPCPIVIRLNGSDGYFCHLEKRKQKLKNYWFEKTALKSADSIVSVSQFTADVTKKIYRLRVQIPVIPNSIDSDHFSPTLKAENNFEILYFGTIIRKKGVIELAKIFNEIIKSKPGCKMLMIGKDVVDICEKESTLRLFFTQLDSEAKQNITYLPEVLYSEIKDYISSSTVIVLPSFAEALPMTWLEAMSMQKPLVTSNIGWAKEVMIDGETGFTEDPRNHSLFASKIIKILADPLLAENMGRAARNRIKKKFCADVVNKSNIKYYKTIILAVDKTEIYSNG